MLPRSLREPGKWGLGREATLAALDCQYRKLLEQPHRAGEPAASFSRAEPLGFVMFFCRSKLFSRLNSC
jgi:hypothetical protein